MRNGFTRRDFNKTCAAGLLTLTVGRRLAAAQTRKRPNVLLITTDQQRVDAMSAVGNKWVKTPHMDSIVANGVYFRKSYCPYPLCSPSRSSLHTGRTPHEIAVDRNTVPIDPAITISGQVFKAAGYDTGYSGKWHMPATYPADGIAGFEVLNKIERSKKMAKGVDEATMNQAIEFLKRKRDKPFYLVVSFINPHDICLLAGENSPLLQDVMKRYMPAEGAKTPPLPDNFPLPAGAPESFASRAKHADWSDEHWRDYRYAYFRMMEDVDRQVGQVLDTLRAVGQEDNTLIIFTSDHGEGLGCHHWTGKMMYFDGEAAVPLIVSWKGVTPAGRIDKDHLVTALDVLPTICDYAGIDPPEKMRGESLRAAIERPDTPGHEFVVSEMASGAAGKRSFMVRTKQYKYMVFPNTPPVVSRVEPPVVSRVEPTSEMFFDLDSDPGEMKNLAGDEALAGELDRHRNLLAQWKELTEEAQYPVTAASGKRKGRGKNNAPGQKSAADKKPAAKSQSQGAGKKGKGQKSAAAAQ